MAKTAVKPTKEQMKATAAVQKALDALAAHVLNKASQVEQWKPADIAKLGKLSDKLAVAITVAMTVAVEEFITAPQPVAEVV